MCEIILNEAWNNYIQGIKKDAHTVLDINPPLAQKTNQKQAITTRQHPLKNSIEPTKSEVLQTAKKINFFSPNKIRIYKAK